VHSKPTRSRFNLTHHENKCKSSNYNVKRDSNVLQDFIALFYLSVSHTILSSAPNTAAYTDVNFYNFRTLTAAVVYVNPLLSYSHRRIVKSVSR